MDKKILIVGMGPYPKGFASDWLLKHSHMFACQVEYRQLEERVEGSLTKILEEHQCDIHLLEIGTNDFNGIERRISNAMIYGNSHPEIYWPEPMKEPPPDQRKGPKGPRNRWGKL